MLPPRLLRLLPVGTKITGRDSHPLENSALARRTGYRIYSAVTLLELGFIVKAREIGFSLEEIKPAIRHLQSPPEQCQELIDSLTTKGAEIEARIAQDRLRLAHLKKLITRLQQR